MRKTEIVSAVKVTLKENDDGERKSRIAHLKQKANCFGAKCLCTEERQNEAVVYFTGDNLETLSVVLNN